MENKIEDALNIVPVEPKKAEVSEILPPQETVKNIDDQAEQDFQDARRNIKKIIDDGSGALTGILSLADASEHPRVFEVAGQIIKTLVDANKDLLALHKQKKELRKSDEGESNPQSSPKQVTNNAYFVGSTAELQALVNKRRTEGNDQ